MMSKLNLNKLLHETPQVSINTIEEALRTQFPTIINERRNDILFNFQIRCLDKDNKDRLLVVYGWSERKERWYFETLPATTHRKSKC